MGARKIYPAAYERKTPLREQRTHPIGKANKKAPLPSEKTKIRVHCLFPEILIMPSRDHSNFTGYYYAISAMLMWGMFPIYWSLLQGVSTLEILGHRTLWCVIFTTIVLMWQKRFNLDTILIRPRKEWLILTASALMIGSNWGLFIWAVHHERVLEASMGYFLTPLLSIMMGRFIFSEALKPLHCFAIALAAMGVIVQVVAAGVTPWIGLAIAASFSLYGALRKFATADSLIGLLIETLVLAPIALAYIIWQFIFGEAAFINSGISNTTLLVLGGAVTAIPLMLYVSATRLLALSVVGFLFYVNPSIQFLVGWLYFDEPFSMAELAGFAFIWAGLIVFTVDSYGRK